MTQPDGHSHDHPDEGELPIEELARRQGVKPIASIDELAHPNLWESDEEYEEFLADLYATRRAGLASASSSSIPTSRRPS